MAKVIPSIDYGAECKNIRDVYVGATLSQRYKVLCDRLGDFGYNCPDKLVTCVTAVEAYARSILVQRAGEDVEPRRKAYDDKWRYGKPMDMLDAILNEFGLAEGELFREDNKALVEHAVEYRHMLVHEGTYLGQDKFPSMIEACLEVLDKLADLTGIPEDRRYNGKPSLP